MTDESMWQPPPPSAGLKARVLNAFDRERRSRKIRRAGAVGLALCLIAATAVSRWRREPPPREKESLTEFMPLMDAQPPLGRPTLVRAVVPVSMMRKAGVPGWETAGDGGVEADVLLGEEGWPRAIRFVVARR